MRHRVREHTRKGADGTCKGVHPPHSPQGTTDAQWSSGPLCIPGEVDHWWEWGPLLPSMGCRVPGRHGSHVSTDKGVVQEHD